LLVKTIIYSYPSQAIVPRYITQHHIEYSLTYRKLYTPHIYSDYVHYANPRMQFQQLYRLFCVLSAI